jgi:hypothetical protein
MAVALPACTATIHRINAPNIEAEIVGSDGDGLQVASDQGATYRIPRDSVAEIDHPGDVAAIVGLAAAMVGGLVAVTAGGAGNNESRRGAFIPGLVLSTTGFALLLGGLIPYSRSLSASRAFRAAPPRLGPLPSEARWGAPATPAPPVIEVKPAAPEPPLSEALLPMPSWTEDPEPAAAPPPPKAPATDAPVRAKAIEPKSGPIFKPAPPAAPR